VKPGANGYRLPTEAEWEKAARGGKNAHRFPWSDADTITESRANYESEFPGYDLGPSGFNPIGAAAGVLPPYTTPVASFPPNDYGLYDMAGNVCEWCWDAYLSNYYADGQVDPQGPTGGLFGISRIVRGGSWEYDASYARCANRGHSPVGLPLWTIGLRCVRSL
jgi:formylglycine-generating enzyme required for sulfatase activity